MKCFVSSISMVRLYVKNNINIIIIKIDSRVVHTYLVFIMILLTIINYLIFNLLLILILKYESIRYRSTLASPLKVILCLKTNVCNYSPNYIITILVLKRQFIDTLCLFHFVKSRYIVYIFIQQLNSTLK